MMRNVFWAVMTVIAIAYAVVIWGWWQDGTAMERNRASDCTDSNHFSREQIDRVPQSCVREWVEVNVK